MWDVPSSAAPHDAVPGRGARPGPGRRLSLPRLRLPSVQLPSIKLPRLRLPHLRLPAISMPRLKMPRAPRSPSLALPHAPRLKRPKPGLPTVAAPSPWPAIQRLVSRLTSRNFWTLTREDAAGKGRDYTRFAVLLGGFSIVALTTLIVVLIAALVSGDGSQAPAPFDSTPPATATRAPTAPGGLTDAPWIDAQLLQDDPLAAADVLWDAALATHSTELGEAAIHIKQATEAGDPLDEDYLCPILDLYNADYSTGRAGAPACGDALVTPPLGGDISLAMWANELNAWWFGALPEGFASYSEGDEAPFLLTWAAEPGEEYKVEITYTCSVNGVPAIDILSGVQSADAEIFETPPGPGDDVPDAAVLLPDTPDLAFDDGSVRLLYLYGGDFLLLPEGPEPASACEDERTIAILVHADSDEMTLMGSVRFADSDNHAGQGAADATAGISLSASVSAVGTATAVIEPGVIAP